MECNICYDNFNKRDRIKLICPYCSIDICTKCHQHYLIDSLNEPHCMKCKKEYSTEFFLSNFPKTFIKEYNESRKDLMLQKEKLFIEDTIPIILNERQKSKLIKIINNKNDEIKKLRDEINVLYNQYAAIDNSNRNKSSMNNIEKIKIQCPTIDCKGICSNYECPLCEIKLCKKCHVILNNDQEHFCNEDDIKTVQTIYKECRSCPNCSTIIYKTQGCDQMFCVKCNCAFSWKTGEEVRGQRIHNPHYFEYLQTLNEEELIRHQQQLNNYNRCERDNMPSPLSFRRKLKNIKKPDSFSTFLSELYRTIIHIIEVESRRFRFRNNDTEHNFDTFKDLRILYLKNKLSEFEFKRKMAILDKAEKKKRELSQILDAFQIIMINYFILFIDQYPENDQELYQKTIQEFIPAIYDASILFYNRFNHHLYIFDSKMENPFNLLKMYFDSQKNICPELYRNITII